jgi:hypothetical protein
MTAIWGGPGGDWWKKAGIQIYGWLNAGANVSTSKGGGYANFPAGGTDSTPYLFMDETGTTPVTSSAYFGTGNGANSTGLVTGINYTPATGTSTPEPASLVLVLAGIGLIGYKVRRHRTS